MRLLVVICIFFSCVFYARSLFLKIYLIFIFAGHSLFFVLNRSADIGDIFNCNIGYRFFITIQSSCIALAMSNILCCMSSRWRSTAGHYTNIWKIINGLDLLFNW